MKKTQMIHSPRTFKLGLGLIVAAGLASMPVLTGASERADKKAIAAMTEKAEANEKAANEKLAAAGKSVREQPTTESIMRRIASAKSKARSKGRSTNAEELARERIAKAEVEAKKLAARLTPTQKKKLLSLLNDAKSSQLTEISGVGESRSSAITKARPIESIEDLRKVKGVGLKTYAEVVDHAKSLTRRTSKTKSSAATKGSSKSSKSGDSPKSKSKA